MPEPVQPYHNPNEGRIIYNAGFDELTSWFTTATGSTRVQPGLNIYTGGTANNPTINVSAATLNYLSATTISGGTLYSGSTNLYGIFVGIGTPSVFVRPGLNIYTGGTSTAPTINVSAATLNYLSASTISGGTLYSGLTNLYDIFQSFGGGVSITSLANIVIGGISSAVTISLYQSPSINSLTASGSSVFKSLLNISGNTSIGSSLYVSGSSTFSSPISGSYMTLSSLSGSNDRFVSADSGGTMSATRQMIDGWNFASSAKTLLSTSSNWSPLGIYTGSTLDSTYQGQMYYDGDFFYMAVSNNTFIRLIRG